jgi:hypothetical protein
VTPIAAWPALAAALLALPACARETHDVPEVPSVHLSTDNPDGNARAVAEFVRDVCIAHIGDPGGIAGAIEDKRWPAEEDIASAGQMVTVRDLEHGRIAYSALPVSAPGGSFDDCQIELDGAVAPALAPIRPLVEQLLRGVSPRLSVPAPDRFVWTWRVPPNGERQLTLAASAPSGGATRPGLVIHVSRAEYTLGTPSAPPADDDATLNEISAGAGVAANVANASSTAR